MKNYEKEYSMDKLNIFEGSLWRDNVILRETYAQHFPTIETGEQFRASIRAGEYAWPGGYQLAFVTSDGALLCWDCAKNEAQQIIWSIRHQVHDGWMVTAVICTDHMDDPEYCAHCNKPLNEIN